MAVLARLDINAYAGSPTPPNPPKFSFMVDGVQYVFEYSGTFSSGNYFYKDAETLEHALQRLGFRATVVRSGTQITITATNYGWSFEPVSTTGGYSGVSVNSIRTGTGQAFLVPYVKTDVTIRGTSTGSITLNPEGGNGGYTYQWNDGPTTKDRTNLPAGEYTCTVTEQGAGAGATKVIRTVLVVINEPDFTPIGITAVITDAVCYGSSTGVIVLTASGGAGGYTYAWADGPTSKNRTQLRAGVYTVTVTDSAGNTGTKSFEVKQNPEIKIVATVDEDDVTLQVTGGIPGYTFSWSDGSTAQNRTNLAAGVYTVTVTDSVGCTKLATVRVQPFQFYFSKNPVPLQVIAASPETKTNLTFICQVWIEKEYLSGVYTQIALLEQPADSDGSTTFDVQTLLDAYLTPYLPEGKENVISRADSLFKRFYLRYTEKYGSPATEAPYTQVDVRYVLLGGLSFEEYSRNVFFTSYLPTERPFFTWEPVKKEVFYDQPEFLYYMPDSFTLTIFEQVCRIHYTDGTMETFTVGTANAVNRYELYCLPAGYNQLQLAGRQPTKMVSHWEIYITDGAVAISQVRRYVLRTDTVAQRRYFLYLNSLGGYNTLCATGKATVELEPKATELERILPAVYNASQGEVTTVRKYAENSFRIDTGYLPPDWLAALADFVISESVLWYRDGLYLGGKIELRNPKVLDEMETDNSINFEFVLPKMTSYTPKL